MKCPNCKNDLGKISFDFELNFITGFRCNSCKNKILLIHDENIHSVDTKDIAQEEISTLVSYYNLMGMSGYPSPEDYPESITFRDLSYIKMPKNLFLSKHLENTDKKLDSKIEAVVVNERPIDSDLSFKDKIIKKIILPIFALSIFIVPISIAIYDSYYENKHQNNYSSEYLEHNEFRGYDCVGDCSGHEAGYDWAMEKEIESSSDCDTKSNSFNEGCEAYIKDSTPDYDY